MGREPRYLARWEVGDVGGVVVAVDVLRAFTTAAVAFAAGPGEAERTLALGAGHVHPDDIVIATDVDRFAFAMEVARVEGGLRLAQRPA